MNIKDVTFNEEKPTLQSETQSFLFDKIIIACGAFSKRLTDNLDEKMPLDTERVIMSILKVVIIFLVDL